VATSNAESQIAYHPPRYALALTVILRLQNHACGGSAARRHRNNMREACASVVPPRRVMPKSALSSAHSELTVQTEVYFVKTALRLPCGVRTE
jgi:hypothetical protein